MDDKTKKIVAVSLGLTLIAAIAAVGYQLNKQKLSISSGEE